MLPQAVAIRAAAIVGVGELNRFVLPAAHATDFIGPRRLFVERDEAAAGTRELATRGFARLAKKAIRDPHRVEVRPMVGRSGHTSRTAAQAESLPTGEQSSADYHLAVRSSDPRRAEAGRSAGNAQRRGVRSEPVT
jgi:hypothetical protein